MTLRNRSLGLLTLPAALLRQVKLFMSQSAFDPNHQQTSTSSKIVVGLERISEAFKALLWEHAKAIGLSPIQIQVLIFVRYHAAEQCTVSALSREFNVTKPTISDAVKALEKKELISKNFATSDSRSYQIALSEAGSKTVLETEQFANPIQQHIDGLSMADQNQLYAALLKVVSGLNRSGVLTVQRTCSNCKYYSSSYDGHYCNLLNQPLLNSEIRLDCPEFESKD